jgi:hypothetical protein
MLNVVRSYKDSLKSEGIAMERLPKREEVMNSPSVHNLTKAVLNLSGGDCVDAYHDVLLAAKVLKREMMVALGRINDDHPQPVEFEPLCTKGGTRHSYAWSGNMPCTGMYRCVYCGQPEDPWTFNGKKES